MLAQLQISQTIGTGPGCSYWLSWAIIVPCLFEDCLLVVVVAVVVFFNGGLPIPKAPYNWGESGFVDGTAIC